MLASCLRAGATDSPAYVEIIGSAGLADPTVPTVGYARRRGRSADARLRLGCPPGSRRSRSNEAGTIARRGDCARCRGRAASSPTYIHDSTGTMSRGDDGAGLAHPPPSPRIGESDPHAAPRRLVPSCVLRRSDQELGLRFRRTENRIPTGYRSRGGDPRGKGALQSIGSRGQHDGTRSNHEAEPLSPPRDSTPRG
jgi:hypothetical protein